MLNQTSLFATGAMMLAGIVAVGGMPQPANAQVEEIVVTARKKEESLQEVPLSIAAFSGEQMRRRGIANNYDVAAFTPNFNTAKRVGRTLDRPTIRGMANPATRGEANASYFVDGMFVSGTISTATTNSMERVEVLRGPQSAQFGRATFSGAVNYITRKPTDEWAGELNTRTGTHSDYQAAGWVSGPIVPDTLRFLASASWENYGGQWHNALEPNSAYVPGDPNSPFTKVFDGRNTEGDQSRLGREKTVDVLTKLLFTPFDSTEISLKYNFTRGDDGHFPANSFFELNCYVPDDPSEPWYNTSPGTYCGEFKIDGTVNRKNIPDIRNGLRTNSQIIGGLPEAATIAVPTDPGLQRDTHRVLGEWVQDVFGWTSTLRGGFTRDDFDAAYDLDHTEARAVWGLFAFATKEDRQDYSFEYSIESPVDRPVRAKLGVYYYDFENEFIQRSFTGPFAVFSTPPGTFYGAPRTSETENKSVFGGISVDLADDWSLDFEARWAKDEKSITSGQLSETDFALTPIFDSLSFTNFTPRITLNWQASDDLMVYVLAAKGNKPGDFNSEYYRADVPAEFTSYLLNCTPGDPVPVSLPLIASCTQEDKDLLHVSEEEQWTYEAGFKSSWW
ncbi:MAG: TonB-dependent receptor, partial [Proteobacteria bacterium]